jgi:basic membrane lipoprotein Med (substrate-binding protein (PBP1-ABC) superfamily)
VLIDAAADLNMDGIQDAPNIYSALFAHDEMGYIAGYAAGLKTQGFAGFISEEDSPACKEYEAGFVAGAKAANPEAEPIIVYLQPGRTSAATIAEIEGLAGLGIDIAFSIVEKQEYVSALSKTPLQLITVSTLTPQPANRVMSVCKEYSNAISIIANDYANGRFIGQMRVFSAREKCISFISVDDAFMSQSLLAKLNEMAKTLGTFDIPITD